MDAGNWDSSGEPRGEMDTERDSDDDDVDMEICASLDPTVCGCCRSRFTSAAGDHVPLCLPCGDTCCSECVAVIADCYKCQAQVGEGPHPHNRFVLNLIESVSVASISKEGGEGQQDGREVISSLSVSPTSAPLSSSSSSSSSACSSSSSSSSSSSVSSSTMMTPETMVRDPTKCSVCVESFTAYPGEHIPLLLPCGHCFCSACVAFFERRECPECPECRAKMGRKDLPRNFALLDLIASISTVPATSGDNDKEADADVGGAAEASDADVGDKRKRALDGLDGFTSSELLAMFQEKKKRENDTKLAELAVRQAAAEDEVAELERALVAPEAARASAQAAVRAAEAEIFRIRTELDAKESQLADISQQMRSIEGVEDGGSSSGISGGGDSSPYVRTGQRKKHWKTIEREEREAEEREARERVLQARSSSSSSSSSSARSSAFSSRSASVRVSSDPGQQLYEAARDGQTAALRQLVQLHREAGTLEEALAWEHSFGGGSALQTACIQNHVDVVKVLIEAGVDVNKVNPQKGSTALMSATGAGFRECMGLLLAVPGIQVNIKDTRGNTALGRAKAEGTRKLLIAAGGTL